MQYEQRTAGHGHVADGCRDIADDARIRRAEYKKAGLCFGHAGLRLQCFDLCLCRQPLGLCALQ